MTASVLALSSRREGRIPAGTHTPTATQAHDQLVQALREQSSWEKRAKDAKELLKQMLKSRKDAAELAQHYDIRWASLRGPSLTRRAALASLPERKWLCRPAPVKPAAPGGEGYSEPPELPDSVSMAMLQREVLLTESKLHALDYELVTSERKLRQLRSQLRQVCPSLSRSSLASDRSRIWIGEQRPAVPPPCLHWPPLHGLAVKESHSRRFSLELSAG